MYQDLQYQAVIDLIHSTRACTPGETIGMRIGPNEIHIMARSEG